MLKLMLDQVRATGPLVQCITNFVTVNDCANIVLACGGSPTMAHHPEEAGEIAAGCRALVLNMGNVEDIEGMVRAGRTSNQLHHPIVLDPVAVGASALRRSTFRTLTDAMQMSVIRGNASEIRYIATGTGSVAGVDAALEDRITQNNLAAFGQMASELAARLNCVISISGEIDIVASSDKAYAIYGGCPTMSRITGTGCMLTAMMGAFCGANPDHILEAVLGAAAAMNVAGDIARSKTEALGGGTMTFRLHMIDAINLMTGEQLEELAHVEEIPLCHL